MRLNAILQRSARIILSCVLRVMPIWRHCVVVGWPDTEGNSVEVLRHLLSRYRGKIYWLVSSPASELMWLVGGVAHQHLVVIRKNSLHALFCYLTAEAVFFTHGLFFSPKPAGRRTFVNLWHGDGPKNTENKSYRHVVSSSIVVAGTQLWGGYKADYFGLTRDSVAVVGNPRIDQFERPATDQQLTALGLDPRKAIVLWLPTYRAVRGGLNQQWHDTEVLSAQEEIRQTLRCMASLARRSGLQMVFKPHPMEADRYREVGVKLVSENDLSLAKVGFYQLVARSAALITDYSSIWTDFLVLDRPIGFYCPDLKSYELNRGFNVPNFGELLPGDLLSTAQEATTFITKCVDAQYGADLRKRSIKHTGAVISNGATERLFVFVNSHRKLNGHNLLY